MILAIKGQQILVREIETRRVISSVSWNKSVVWAIHEHQHSRNFKRKHHCLYIVHSLGVDLLEHDGVYGNLRITQQTVFGDLAIGTGVVQQTASLADFEQTKIWNIYSGFRYNYLLVVKDDKVISYHISDSDDRFLNQRIIYETHSRFINVRVVRTQYSPSNRETYLYVGLSDGSLVELNGKDYRQLR